MKRRYFTLFLIFFITLFPCFCLGVMTPSEPVPHACHAMSHDVEPQLPDADCQHCFVKDQWIKTVNDIVDAVGFFDTFSEIVIIDLLVVDRLTHQKVNHTNVLENIKTIRLLC